MQSMNHAISFRNLKAARIKLPRTHVIVLKIKVSQYTYLLYNVVELEPIEGTTWQTKWKRFKLQAGVLIQSINLDHTFELSITVMTTSQSVHMQGS